jgi:hypothetical protein
MAILALLCLQMNRLTHFSTRKCSLTTIKVSLTRFVVVPRGQKIIDSNEANRNTESFFLPQMNFVSTSTRDPVMMIRHGKGKNAKVD